jgi:TRAP-type C4-dicarboxylate transport system substrate-binding protein
MKNFASLIAAAALYAGLVSCLPAFADDTPAATPATPVAAKDAFQQMTPDQKQAMREQAKATAQQKQAAWQQLSPEEKQAKRDAMRDRMPERVAQFRASRHR